MGFEGSKHVRGELRVDSLMLTDMFEAITIFHYAQVFGMWHYENDRTLFISHFQGGNGWCGIVKVRVTS